MRSTGSLCYWICMTMGFALSAALGSCSRGGLHDDGFMDMNPLPPSPPTGVGSISGRMVLAAPLLETWDNAPASGPAVEPAPATGLRLGVFMTGFGPPAGALTYDVALINLGGGRWELPFAFSGLAAGSYEAALFDYYNPDWGIHEWFRVGATRQLELGQIQPAISGLEIVNSFSAGGTAVVAGRVLISGLNYNHYAITLSRLEAGEEEYLSPLYWSPRVSILGNGRQWFRISNLAAGEYRIYVDGAVVFPRPSMTVVNGNVSVHGDFSIGDGEQVTIDLYAAKASLAPGYDWANWRGLEGFIYVNVTATGELPWTGDIVISAHDAEHPDSSAVARWYLLPSDLNAHGKGRLMLGYLAAGAYSVKAMRLAADNLTPPEVLAELDSVQLALPPKGEEPDSLFEYPPLPQAYCDLALQL